MSLEEYRGRMIVLRPGNTAYEAATAMADNHVGSVIVADKDGVTGIVTDRDLAVKVMAPGLDPQSTFLHEVMTENVHTIDVSASVKDAVALMRKYACRRLPLLYGFTPIGMVTLDDLLAEQEIKCAEAAAVICAQLEQGAKNKRPGTIRPKLPTAPRRMTNGPLDDFVQLLSQVTGLRDPIEVDVTLRITIGAIVRRLRPEAARQLISQLPNAIRDEMRDYPYDPVLVASRESIEEELETCLSISSESASRRLAGVAEVLSATIAAGAVPAVVRQLSQDMKELFWPPTWAAQEAQR